MMVHGGAWFFGDKLYFAKVQEASFSECTVVAVNYTLHPHATCEEMLVDVSKAIAWTLNNICRPTHDDDGAVPLVVFGHSSGAHLVMLCAAYRSCSSYLC
jgi:acetyl esterase/lipase